MVWRYFYGSASERWKEKGSVMVKNWDYYKNEHLQDEINNSNTWFSWIEKNIESPIERIAFMYLTYVANQLFQDYEVVIKPQVKIANYTVDFLVYHWDTDTKIIVECDGHDFHEKTKAQAAHDKKRDRFLIKQGYIVLRYTGSQICDDPMEIFEDVAELLMEKKTKIPRSSELV